MPKVVFDQLNYTSLVPMDTCLQLMNKSVRYLVGIAEDVPMKIRKFFVPVDFVILDTEVDAKILLILGRPFLSTANANIDIDVGVIHLHINAKDEKFNFKPRVEQCLQVKAQYVPKKWQGPRPCNAPTWVKEQPSKEPKGTKKNMPIRRTSRRSHPCKWCRRTMLVEEGCTHQTKMNSLSMAEEGELKVWGSRTPQLKI